MRGHLTGCPMALHRSPIFWVLVIAGTLSFCCVMPSAFVFWGLFSKSDRNAAPSQQSAASSSSSSSNAEAPAVDDDFIYYSKANGLTWVGDSNVAAEGPATDVTGIWRDDRLNIMLRLDRGGQYELSESGNAPSGAVQTVEKGRWAFSDGVLKLTPEAEELQAAFMPERRGSKEAKTPDHRRSWQVTALTIVYHPPGVEDRSVMRQRPGLRVAGEAPTWHYPNNYPIKWTLRSAPK